MSREKLCGRRKEKVENGPWSEQKLRHEANYTSVFQGVSKLLLAVADNHSRPWDDAKSHWHWWLVPL